MNHDFPHNSPAPTPSRANYGFALFLASTSGFIFYCFWSLDFDSFWSSIGLSYLPQTYWAVALPVFVLVSIAFVGLILYPALNLLINCPYQENKLEVDSSMDTLVPPIALIPMSTVSRRLYLKKYEKTDQ